MQGIKIFDRDFFSILVYQTYLMNLKNVDQKNITIFEKLVENNIPKIDFIVYFNIDIKTSILRTEKRDNRKFSKEDICKLDYFITNLKKTTFNYAKNNNIPFVEIDSTDSLDNNLNIIKQIINEL